MTNTSTDQGTNKSWWVYWLATGCIFLDRILADFFFILGGVCFVLAIVGLLIGHGIAGRLFIIVPLLVIPSFYVSVGCLFLLAANQLRRNAPWRWILQVTLILSLVIVHLIAFLSLLNWVAKNSPD